MQRKTLDEQKADLLKRQAQIEARLKAISAKATSAERRLDTRRKIVVGAAVLGAATVTPHHRQWLLGVLRGAPRRPADLAILDALILGLAAPVAAAEGSP